MYYATLAVKQTETAMLKASGQIATGDFFLNMDYFVRLGFEHKYVVTDNFEILLMP